MKIILVVDVFMAYPNHNKPFHIYTDASGWHMGAIIIQQVWSIAYWSHKLTDLQHKYNTMEEELLSIVKA